MSDQHRRLQRRNWATRRIDARVDVRYTLAVIRRLFEPRYRVLAAIILFIGFYKVILAHHQTYTEVDGGFYTDIATHVRDGEGLVTNVSILHKGMPHFPYPTAFYPLWLLVYGYTARFLPVPIVKVGFWLPTLGFFIALALAYVWAKRSFGGPLLPRLIPHFDSGHLFVLMLGLNWNFFVFTSMPHTEGLAYALFFAALVRLNRLWERPGIRAGLEMGVWCGLVVLTRSQLMLLPLALWATLLGATVVSKSRVRYALMGLGSLGAFLATMTPYYLYLRGFVHDFHWWHTIRVDQARATDILSEIVILKQLPTTWDYLLDRAYGFRVAFQWNSVRGYWRHFYVWHYALIVAAPLVVATALRSNVRKTILRDTWEWLTDERNFNTVFVLVYAAAGFLSIHTMHKDGHGEWNFQRRHGLTSLFLFFLSLRYLLVHHHRAVKACGLALLVSGTIMGGTKCRGTALHTAAAPPRRFRPELVKWINHQHEKFDPLIIADRKPQLLARFTPGVGYHWYFERTYAEDIRAMVEKLGVAFVIVDPKQTYETYPFLEDPRFEEWFKKVGTRSGFDIYRPRRVLDSPAWRERWTEADARRKEHRRRRRP